MNKYIVVCKAHTGARFAPDGGINLEGFPCGNGAVDIRFRTRYVDEGFQVTIPRELIAEVSGFANSLDIAIKDFLSVSQSIVPIISFITNIAVNNLTVVLAYDASPNKKERDFYQQFVPEEKGIPRQGRGGNAIAVVELIKELTKHPEQVRLRRAISYYHQGLLDWIPGREIFSVGFFYMGIEAITKAVMRQLCHRFGMNEDQLIKKWKINKKELYPEVRRKYIFKNDNECYVKAKEASDSLEHGFLSFGEIQPIAKNIFYNTANYLRSAIVDISGVQEFARRSILDTPYDKPIGNWTYLKYIRGKLVSSSDKITAEGEEYPIVNWDSTINSVSIIKPGKYEFRISDEIKPKLAEGVFFKQESMVVWGLSGSEKYLESDSTKIKGS